MIVKVAFGKDRLHGMVWTGHQDHSRSIKIQKFGGITIWKLFVSYMYYFSKNPCHIRSSLKVDF